MRMFTITSTCAVVRRGLEDAVAAVTGGEIGVLVVEAVEVEWAGRRGGPGRTPRHHSRVNAT